MATAAQAQQAPAATGLHPSIDVALTYTAERGKVASMDCGCFWFRGGSASAAMTFYHGLGVAANLTGVHTDDIGPQGSSLDKVMFAMGPRYTYDLGGPLKPRGEKFHGTAVFGEALFGGAHGFHGIFPSSGTTTADAATSFAMQFGGGVDLRLAHHLGVRAIEADYVRSTFPNNAANVQNDLRLGAGIAFHFKP